MTLSRRDFLRSGGLFGTALLAPLWPRLARASAADPVLIVVFLRGGADGLNLVVPAGDPDYYALRPDIQLAPGAEIPLDGFFGLHPLLGSLLPMYADGDLAFVHAVGSPDPTRSHFEAQDFMERAAPGDPTVLDGWLNRLLAEAGASDSWSGISFGPALALALRGERPGLAIQTLEKFKFRGMESSRWVLESLYRGAAPMDLEGAARSGFAALDVVGAVTSDATVPFPASSFGTALRDASALVQADVGVRVVTLNLGGWDHHEGETDTLARVAPDLGAGLAALRLDLGDHWQRTAVVVMSEFGRTAAQNGSLGTDHGHGGAMLVAGGDVAGGRVLTRGGWPGLAPSQLYEGRDLAVTTDFRDVFAELLNVHMGLTLAATTRILPGHTVRTATFPGLLA